MLFTPTIPEHNSALNGKLLKPTDYRLNSAGKAMLARGSLAPRDCRRVGQKCVILIADLLLPDGTKLSETVLRGCRPSAQRKISREPCFKAKRGSAAQTGWHPDLIGTLLVKARAALGPNS
jgi:hypothetical protein